MPDYSIEDELMMRRCFALAKKGGHSVQRNPQVGAVITHNNQIIGEGYHEEFGGPHAEVNALNSIAQKNRTLLPQSQIYVSLEPCNHFGKTPPCVDAILKAGIPKVTIANIDPSFKMSGKSISKLRNSGVTVRVGFMADEGRQIIRKFVVNQQEQMPYTIVKWAQSKDGFMGQPGKQIWFSNEQSRLLVHRWREECDAIMAGTQTFLTDDPLLTNRRGVGRSPMRIVLDRTGRIPASSRVFNQTGQVLLLTTRASSIDANHIRVIYIPESEWSLKKIWPLLYQNGVGSLLLEGGASLLSSVIEDNLWHEGRVIHASHPLHSGIKSPFITGKIRRKFRLNKDKILIFNNLKMNEKLM